MSIQTCPGMKISISLSGKAVISDSFDKVFSLIDCVAGVYQPPEPLSFTKLIALNTVY